MHAWCCIAKLALQTMLMRTLYTLVVAWALLVHPSSALQLATRFKKAAAFITVATAFGTVLNPVILPVHADTYTNERYHTTFNFPSKWVYNLGTLAGDRKVEAWVSPDDPQTSASLVISPIPADFTRLTSFGGGKETLREYLIPRGEGIACTVVSEGIKGETYTLEYVVSAPEQPTRHVTTVFALRPAESVVGLTVQTPEESYSKNKVLLESIVPSLRVDNP